MAGGQTSHALIDKNSTLFCVWDWITYHCSLFLRSLFTTGHVRTCSIDFLCLFEVSFYTAVLLSLCCTCAPEVLKFAATGFIVKSKSKMLAIEFDWWDFVNPLLKLGCCQWIEAAIFLWGWIISTVAIKFLQVPLFHDLFLVKWQCFGLMMLSNRFYSTNFYCLLFCWYLTLRKFLCLFNYIMTNVRF